MIIPKLMKEITEEFPVIKNCLEQYKGYHLKEYLNTLRHEQNPAEEIQSSKELSDAVFDYLKEVVDINLARKTAAQIQKQKILLSANHHEVEFCVQTLQGNMLYERLLAKHGFHDGILPILSCNTVNLCNSNYPRGMLIYHTPMMIDIVKIPIFPSKYRNKVVAVCEPFTKEMIQNAINIIIKKRELGILSSSTSNTALELLDSTFQEEDVMSCKRYAEQICMLNERLGHRLYKDKKKEFIYIEAEEISRRLIENDLAKKNCLGYFILFEKQIRERILINLNQTRGCWDSEYIKNFILQNICTKKLINGGTHFFWGIDQYNRRFPLLFSEEKGGPMLLGIDMSGTNYMYEYAPESLIRLLKTRRIVPGMLLTFLQLYFFRDFTLLGGCFQSDYLKQMQQGVIKSLEESGWDKNDVLFLKNKNSYYFSGPLFLMGGQSGHRYPMSTLEILERGGVTVEEVEGLMNISMMKAHEIGLYHFYIDISHQEKRLSAWWNLLSKEL